MARLSAFVGLSFFMALAAGCGGDDTSSQEPPIDVNVQLAKVTKERDEAQAELKREREAEMSNLARFEAAEAAATTGNDELRRQLHTLRNQFTETQKELEKARKEAADLKAAGAQGEHADKNGDAAKTDEHKDATKVPAAPANARPGACRPRLPLRRRELRDESAGIQETLSGDPGAGFESRRIELPV